MIKAIIIDDEKNGAEVLQLLLEQNCPTINIIAIKNNPEEGIEAILTLKPDLVFLDIEMPTATGFDVIEATKAHPYEVVFTTAYEHYAIKAFKAQATDYLLKPIDVDELIQTIEVVEEKLMHSPNAIMKEFAKTDTSMSLKNKKISIPTAEGILLVLPDELFYLESDSNYTKIYLTDGRKIVVSKTLKYLEELFTNTVFYRAHSSFLVNLNHVDTYIKGDGGHLILKNKASIPVSRSNKVALLKLLGISEN